MKGGNDCVGILRVDSAADVAYIVLLFFPNVDQVATIRKIFLVIDDGKLLDVGVVFTDLPFDFRPGKVVRAA